jgi:hypothetical protein
MSPMSAETEKPKRRSRAIRILAVSLSVVLFLAVLLVGGWSVAKYRAAHARAQWELTALGRLAALSVTNEQIRAELIELKSEQPGNSDFRWTRDHVLLMTNGEYIIYAFWHGDNSGFVDHLFLGHGSDGRWLYSTYHFCNSMVGVLGEDPPSSVAEFERRFFVREFDGRSDKCLKHTWPLDNQGAMAFQGGRTNGLSQ